MAVLLDSAFKSPSVTITGSGLIGNGYTGGAGCVISTGGIASGTGYFTATINNCTSSPTVWVGLANRSHAFTDNGASWAGGDMHSGGVYNQGSGSVWAAMAQPAFTMPAFTIGDVIRIDIDRTAGTWKFSKNGTQYPTAFTAPSGTLYAAIGFDGNYAGQMTCDFAGMSSGPATFAFAGASTGAAGTTGADLARRPLGGNSVGLSTAAMFSIARRPFAGASAGLGATSGIIVRRVAFAGGAAGAATTAGALVKAGGFGGTSIGLSTAAGAAGHRAPLAGVSTGASATVLAFIARRPFAGASSGYASTSGDLVGGATAAEADSWIIGRRRRR